MRRRTRELALILLGTIVAIGPLVVGLFYVAPRRVGIARATVAAVGMFALASFYQRSRRRFTREHGCPSCGYSLQDLPDRGRCPECGATLETIHIESDGGAGGLPAAGSAGDPRPVRARPPADNPPVPPQQR